MITVICATFKAMAWMRLPFITIASMILWPLPDRAIDVINAIEVNAFATLVVIVEAPFVSIYCLWAKIKEECGSETYETAIDRLNNAVNEIFA